MPNDGDTKACTHPQCDGTMTYYSTTRDFPRTGVGDDRGQIKWSERRQPPGWYCDRNSAHDEPV